MKPLVPFLFLTLPLATVAPLFGQTTGGSAPTSMTGSSAPIGAGSSAAPAGVPTSIGTGAQPVGPARPGVPNPHATGSASAELFPEIKDQPKGSATLKGKLDHKTPGDSSLGGIEVRVFAFGEKQRKGEWRTETADDGTFHFSDLSADPNLKYIVSALYQGVVYLSEGNSFSAGSESLNTDIQVYDSAPVPGPLIIDSMHVIVQADPASGGMQVTEVIAFNNPGDKTLVGSADSTLTLQLDMPAGASNVQVMQGLLPAQVFMQEKALIYTGPLYPGVNQAVITYQIEPRPSWIFRRRLPVETKEVDVFVTQNGPAVLSPQLEQKEPIELQGTTFNRYGGDPIQAGGGITFQVGGAEGGGTGGPSPIPATPLATVIGLGTLVFVAWPLFRKRKTVTVPLSKANPRQARILELIRERDAQMASVKEIDDDNESDKLSQEDYQRLRERHKALAIEAMKGLAALGVAETLEAPAAIRQSVPEQGQSAPGPGQAATPAVNVHPGQPATPLKFCTACGTPTVPGDKFCGSCGTRLRATDG